MFTELLVNAIIPAVITCPKLTPLDASLLLQQLYCMQDYQGKDVHGDPR